MSSLMKILAEAKCNRTATAAKPKNLRLGIMVEGEESFVGAVRKGAMNEMLASGFLLARGYDVFRNVSSQGPADLVAVNWDTGERLNIDVKSAAFSVGSRDGRETLERAAKLGICIMVVGNDGSVTWHNREEETSAANDNETVYESAEHYARSVS